MAAYNAESEAADMNDDGVDDLAEGRVRGRVLTS